jgi:hypothetical protein
MKRIADDFAQIRARMNNPGRSDITHGTSTTHCAICPKMRDENCQLTCLAEAERLEKNGEA